MKSLYLLCGLAFSGKSTLAAALSSHLGAAVVSLDQINAARGLDGGAGIPPEEWGRTHQQALVEVEQALRSDLSAIVDDTNCFRFLRDNYRSVARRCGVETTVIYLDVPVSVALARLRSNEETGARSGMTEPVFVDLVEKFEPPAADERVLVLPSEAAPETWVKVVDAVLKPMALRAHGQGLR